MRTTLNAHARKSRLYARFALLAGLAALASVGVSRASIDNPTSGATVRGNVTINENQGGRKDLLCSSSGVDSRIWVTRNSDSVIVLDRKKGSAGAWSTVWGTHGLARGSYQLRSEAYDKFTGGFCPLTTNQKSNFAVTLDNLSTTTYTGATSAYYNESFSASGNLKDSTTNAAVSGRTLQFSLGGGAPAPATTDTSGNAATTLSAGLLPGTYSVAAAFDEDCCWRASSASKTFTVLKRPTTLASGGDSSGYARETATLTAHLTDTRLSGAAVAGKTVHFSLGGEAVDATTDIDGVASAEIDLNDTPGTYAAAATFDGDSFYGQAITSQPFTILKRPTSIVYTGPESGVWDDDVDVSAFLMDVRSGMPIEGSSVTFAVGTQTSTVDSGPGGLVLASIHLTDVPGDYDVSASAGDDLYDASTDSTAFTILKRTTALAYTGDTQGAWDGPVTLRALVTDVARGTPLEGLDVSLAMGSIGDVAQTGTDGLATVSGTLTDEPGTYSASAAFTGTDYFVGSADSAGFTITKRPTTLTYDGATEGKHGDTATLSATYTDSLTGDPLPGRSVHFTLGAYSSDQATGSEGTASVVAPMDQDPGSYTVAASTPADAHFEAGSATHAFSLLWEFTFVDDGGSGTVSLDPTTKQFRFVGSSEDSGIVNDPNMLVSGDLVAVAYFGDGFSLVGTFDLATGRFAAAAHGTGSYVLRHTDELPTAPCSEDPQSCLPTVEPPTPPPVPECVPNPAGDPVCP